MASNGNKRAATSDRSGSSAAKAARTEEVGFKIIFLKYLESTKRRVGKSTSRAVRVKMKEHDLSTFFFVDTWAQYNGPRGDASS